MALATALTEVHQQSRVEVPLPLSARQRLWDRLWMHLLAPGPGADGSDRRDADAEALESTQAPVVVAAEEE